MHENINFVRKRQIQRGNGQSKLCLVIMLHFLCKTFCPVKRPLTRHDISDLNMSDVRLCCVSCKRIVLQATPSITNGGLITLNHHFIFSSRIWRKVVLPCHVLSSCNFFLLRLVAMWQITTAGPACGTNTLFLNTMIVYTITVTKQAHTCAPILTFININVWQKARISKINHPSPLHNQPWQIKSNLLVCNGGHIILTKYWGMHLLDKTEV